MTLVRLQTCSLSATVQVLSGDSVEQRAFHGKHTARRFDRVAALIEDHKSR